MFGRALLGAVFPTLCPGCGVRADPVCDRCAAALRPAPSAPPPPGVDAWVAAYAYEGAARELVARVKYRQARAAVPWLAAAVAEAVTAVVAPARFDAVTWAPTTPTRRRARGFDHAELLARSVARRLDLRASAFLARRPGPHQTGLPSHARRRGPAFVVRDRWQAVPARVLLVDDVATTGGTLAAAARSLRVAGAVGVVAATVARTPAGGSGSRIPREIQHVE